MGRQNGTNGRRRKTVAATANHPVKNGGSGGDTSLSRKELQVLTRWPNLATADYVARANAMLPKCETPRELSGVLRCLTAMMGQNQADEHLAIKLASGVSDGQLTVKVVYEQRSLPSAEED